MGLRLEIDLRGIWSIFFLRDPQHQHRAPTQQHFDTWKQCQAPLLSYFPKGSVNLVPPVSGGLLCWSFCSGCSTGLCLERGNLLALKYQSWEMALWVKRLPHGCKVWNLDYPEPTEKQAGLTPACYQTSSKNKPGVSSGSEETLSNKVQRG